MDLARRVRSLGSNRREYVETAVTSHVDRVLDIGCSRGWTLDALTGKAEELWGVDVDESALADARALYPHIRFVHQTAAALPFESNMFDVVILSEVIEHVGDENKQAVIDEVHRVLRRSGLLIFTAPHTGLFAWADPMDFKRRFSAIYRLYMRLARYNPDTPLATGHKHVSPRELSALLDDRFTVEQVQYCGLLTPGITWVLIAGSRLRLLPRAVEESLNRFRAWESGIPYGPWLSFNVRMQARKKGSSVATPTSLTLGRSAASGGVTPG